MLASLKRAVRRALRSRGYDVVRLSDLKRERQVVNAHYRGHCFRCFQGDPQCEFILAGRGWDNQLEPLLAELASRRPTNVVEIGANIGGSLVTRASDYPGLTFHCVEPVPEFFDLLSDNARAYDATNVRLYNQAVSSRDGVPVRIFTQLGTAGAIKSYDGHTPIGSIEVGATTVDALFSSVDVALLKIDTDGFEYEILDGSRRTLEASRPLIFMEFHPDLIRRAGRTPEQLCALLESSGYDVAAIWTNEGAIVDRRSDLRQLPAIAASVAPYVDVLLRPR